ELARRDEKHLVAYYVSEKEVEASDIRTYLSGKVPPYMIPSYFVPLPEFPLTSNGKVDKKKLPAPGPRMSGSREFVKPETPVQESLARVWGEVLGVPAHRIGLNDNFFELGGDSIKAIQVIARLSNYKLTLEISQLFLNPTIRGTAQWAKDVDRLVPPEPVEEREYYGLSSSQRRFYLMQQVNQENTAYNIPGTFTLLSGIDEDQLETIFIKLMKRHEGLRTSFKMINNEPAQIIHDAVDFKMERHNSSRENVPKITANFIRPFDLKSAPLFRVSLIDTGQEKILAVDMHHIISDGLSLQVLSRDFVSLFEGKELAPLPLQYKDYASWQNKLFNQSSYKKTETYWLNTLKHFRVSKIPEDNLPHGQQILGKRDNATIKKDTYIKIETFCHKYKLTKFSFMLSIFLFILRNEIGDHDLTIGSPIANRDHPDLENIIGAFLNVFLLRVILNPDESIITNMLKINNNIIEAIEHSSYPYEDLYYSLKNHYQLQEDELFTILFNYLPDDENSEPGEERNEADKPEKKVFLAPYEVTPKYPLTLYIVDKNDKLIMDFVYRGDIYSKNRIERIIRNYFNFIQTVITDEKTMLSKLLYEDIKDNDVLDEFEGEFENDDLF
ncbi:MAG: condensation domain-containing protein, partial [Candidatus Omnitrophota bacterium]